MTSRSSRAAPSDLEEAALTEALGELGYQAQGPRRSSDTVTWYDTHGGALLRAGCGLARYHRRGTWELLHRDGSVARQSGGAEPPAGSGPVQAALSAALVGMPRCPWLRAGVEELTWKAKDLGGAPLEVTIQRWRFFPPFAETPEATQVVIGTTSMTGDLAAGDYLLALLERRLALLPFPGSPASRGAALLGLAVPGSPLPAEMVVRAGDQVGEAGARVLNAQAWVLLGNRDGAVHDVDPEYVHVLRVATRRARFALLLFSDALDRALCDELRGELSWIARSLGPLRDMDVLMARLPRLLGRIEADEETAAALRRLLESRRAAAQAEVVDCLSSDRCGRLQERLAAIQPSEPVPIDSPALTVEGFAHRRAEKALARIRACVGSGPEHLDPSQLHALRILFKRLRYTCEFFTAISGMEALARTCTSFQDLLGKYQDGSAAIELFGSLSRTARMGPALGALAQVSRESRARARARFLRLWKDEGEDLVRWKPERTVSLL